MGSIELDPDTARALASVLIRDLTITRRNGREIPAWSANVLRDLLEAADEAVCFVSETRSDTIGSVMSSGCLSASGAADLTGVSAQYVRRLASAGRVRRERVGRTWLIDIDSLKNVLGRAEAS